MMRNLKVAATTYRYIILQTIVGLPDEFQGILFLTFIGKYDLIETVSI